jgi:WS/DGAT/MGAT family acyltransferase
VEEPEKFDLHMSDADALMWNIEKDPVLRSTIVTVNRLDRAPDWDRLVDKIDLGSQLIPRLRQRVVTPILRAGPPHWSADPNFDLTYHLRRMRAPEPATFDTVLELARTAAMAGFDRARPLWEFTLVEGLTGGEAALIMKVHHSVTDGVGGMKLAMMLFDMERDPGPSAPAGDPEPLPLLAPLGLVGRALDHNRRRFLGIVRRSLGQVRGVAEALFRDPRGAMEHAALVGGSVARLMAPATAPRSPIMHGRSLSRDLGVLDVPLDDLKRASKAVGQSLNDAFVAAALGGLRRYHKAHGSPCDDLRMTMPINVRAAGSQLGGNHFTPARFLVPLTIEDPEQRMQEVGRLSRQMRDEPAIRLTDTLAGVLNQLPTTVSTALFGAMLKGADFVTSNVPGVPFPVYLAGAELQRNYAFGPLSGAAANITLVSHAGTCCIGINVDRAAVPDRDTFVQCLDEGFAEVLQLG